MTYRNLLDKHHKFNTLKPIRMIGFMLLCTFSLHATADTTDYGMYPFASTSIWKTPLGTGATYQSLSDTESALLRNQNAGCANCAYPWVQGGAFGVYQAKSTDNVMLWTYKARPGKGEWPYSGSYTNGSFSIPTPEGIQFLGSTDRHVVIVAPDKKSAIEVWHGAYNSTTKTYSGDFIAYMDLTGSGISPTDGVQISIRAYGGSLMGGIIRKEELDAGVINHPVAMVISPQQLRKGELVSSAGTRRDMSTQKVWPATTTDGLGYNAYSGSIPMGALFALPPDTDIDSLGLTTDEGKALAKAYKYYGGYVVDAGTNTTSIAALEASCTDEQLQHLQTDKRKILNKLVMVTNNSAEHIGGPGSRLIDVDNQSSSIDIDTSTSSDTTASTGNSSETSTAGTATADTASTSTSANTSAADTTASTTVSSTGSTTDSTASGTGSTTGTTASSTGSTTGTTASSTGSTTGTTASSTGSTTGTTASSTGSTTGTTASSTGSTTGTTASSTGSTTGTDTVTTDTTSATTTTASSGTESTTDTSTAVTTTGTVTTSLATGSTTTSNDTASDSATTADTTSSTTASSSTAATTSASTTKTKTTSSSSGSSSSGSSSGSSVLSDSSTTTPATASTTTSGVISYGAETTTTDASILNELKQTLLSDTTQTSALQASTTTGSTVVTTSSGTSCSQVSCFKAGSLGDAAATQQNTLVAAGK